MPMQTSRLCAMVSGASVPRIFNCLILTCRQEEIYAGSRDALHSRPFDRMERFGAYHYDIAKRCKSRRRKCTAGWMIEIVGSRQSLSLCLYRKERPSLPVDAGRTGRNVLKILCPLISNRLCAHPMIVCSLLRAQCASIRQRFPLNRYLPRPGLFQRCRECDSSLPWSWPRMNQLIECAQYTGSACKTLADSMEAG